VVPSSKLADASKDGTEQKPPPPSIEEPRQPLAHDVQPPEPSPVEDDGPGLQARNVNAWYNVSRKAIENVSINVAPHRITAIIGPSGCGKSTFLRCLNRMHEVIRGARAEGQVELSGQDIYASNVDPVRVRRVVGMVFQKPNPFPMMTIFENVVAGLRLEGGYAANRLEEIAERALHHAALWDEVKDVWKRASGISLSGGQQQRLCIARTLAVEPAVILMDEPCSALDPIATYRIEELMVELKKDYTIAIVTHNMQQASRVSDFTAFMLAEEDRIGRLVEFAPTARIFTNPSERRTEDYITGRFG
jgi:phosphate transport system ATP-binding protein